MQELETEIKKAASSRKTLNIKVLAKATTAVNEKVRQQGLSAKEIIFSRDQVTLENIDLKDEALAEEKMKIRETENIYSAKSKASTSLPAKSANALRGQLVFLKKDGSKLERRDLYLVTETKTEDQTVTLCKLPSMLSGDTPVQFQPHNILYRVKQTDIYQAPNQPVIAEAIEEEFEYCEPELDLTWMTPTWEQPTKHYRYEDDDDDNFDWAENEDETGQNQELLAEVREDQAMAEQLPLVVAGEGAMAEQLPLLGAGEGATIADLVAVIAEVEDQLADEEQEVAEVQDSEQEHEIDQGSEEENDDINPGTETDQEHDEEQEDTDGEDLLEDLGAVGGQHQHLVIQQDQSRKPVKNDIIAFVRNDSWVQAKIRNKVAGYANYYNIIFEDDTEDGIELKLPTENMKESWTLVDKSLWKQTIRVEENIEAERTEQFDRTNTPDSLPNMDQVHSVDNSMDWDNYASDPTYATSSFNDEVDMNQSEEGSMPPTVMPQDTDDSEEEVTSPLGTFRRRGAIRRRLTSGYGSKLVSQPETAEEVILNLTNNLNLILAPRTPIVAESVELDRSQHLSLVLNTAESLPQD